MTVSATATAEILPLEEPALGQARAIRDSRPLRLITCGSVDDGKSTLIGRLLWDTKAVKEDQAATLHRDSGKQNDLGLPDFALLLDGLQAEREQGITIDVAYRYFSTEKRKFIIADTPGHEQYTRNMATGASTCDLAIILVDARYGVQTQTRRHSYIASLLGIKHIVVAVNKMDLKGFDEGVFEVLLFLVEFGDRELIVDHAAQDAGDDFGIAAINAEAGALFAFFEDFDMGREHGQHPGCQPAGAARVRGVAGIVDRHDALLAALHVREWMICMAAHDTARRLHCLARG